jgi:hypothetical protein
VVLALCRPDRAARPSTRSAEVVLAPCRQDRAHCLPCRCPPPSRKDRAEIKTAAPEIRCVAEQISDPAESTRSTNGSALGLIETTAVLFARLLASSRGGAEPSGRCGNLKVPCSNTDRRSTSNKSVKSGVSPIFGAKVPRERTGLGSVVGCVSMAALCVLVLFVLIRGFLMPIPSRAIDDGAQP